MLKFWRHLIRSRSPAELPAAFRLDGDYANDPGPLPLAECLVQLYESGAACIRDMHRLRSAGQSLEALQRQLQVAQAGAGKLMAENDQLRHELAVANRYLEDQSESAQRQYEAMLCRVAGEAFRFQQTLHHLEGRGLHHALGKEYSRVRVLLRRIEGLLREHDVLIIDPTNREPDGTLVDVTDYVTRQELSGDLIVTTLEPVVVQAGRVIARGKVIVGVPQVS